MMASLVAGTAAFDSGTLELGIALILASLVGECYRQLGSDSGAACSGENTDWFGKAETRGLQEFRRDAEESGM